MENVKQEFNFERYLNLISAVITIANFLFAIPVTLDDVEFNLVNKSNSLLLKVLIVLLLETSLSFYFANLYKKSLLKFKESIQSHLILVCILILTAGLTLFNLVNFIFDGQISSFGNCIGLLILTILSFIMQLAFLMFAYKEVIPDERGYSKNEEMLPIMAIFLGALYVIMYFISIFEYLTSISTELIFLIATPIAAFIVWAITAELSQYDNSALPFILALIMVILSVVLYLYVKGIIF